MGNRIFGCDDCQLVCPWNKFASPRALRRTDFQPRHGLDDADLVDLFLWDEATYLARTEGSALRRIGHERWLRNLAVALGNAPATRAVATPCAPPRSSLGAGARARGLGAGTQERAGAPRPSRRSLRRQATDPGCRRRKCSR
jgi:hypothetical protein